MPREIKEINLQIGLRVKSTRSGLKMKREELSRLTGYSYFFIQEVERGRSGLSAESLRAFSRALNVSADFLLNGAPDTNFDFVAQKLNQVPSEKLDHVLRIIDEVVACTKE